LVQLPALLDLALELAGNDYSHQLRYDFRDLAIHKEYAEGLPPVRCEATEIQQVFLNLLANGAQAMADKEYPPGETPSFRLRIEADDDQVRVEIADNGPGIPEEFRRRIFEPFFTTKEAGQGTGLGLSLCYFIVTEHYHGTLDVLSEEGCGTRFLITLPCRHDDRA
jgi:signal transduction histidine kinase